MKRFSALTIVLLLAAGCGDGTASSFPKLEVDHSPDLLTFLAQTYDKTVTDSLSYEWFVSGTTVKVSDLGSRITGGTATLVIRDNTGNQVYTQDLNLPPADSVTGSGTGNWRVDVKVRGLTGDIVFQIQKLH